MPTKTRPAADIRKYLEAGIGGGRGRRSQVYRWLFLRADDFEKLLDELQPSWQMVANALARCGVRDGSGKPPTAVRVCRAWIKVKQDRENAQPPPALPVYSPDDPHPAQAHHLSTNTGTSNAGHEPTRRGFEHDSIVSEDELHRRVFGLPPKVD